MIRQLVPFCEQKEQVEFALVVAQSGSLVKELGA
jgi:hypothetical protein